MNERMAAIEALLFVAGEDGLTIKQMSEALLADTVDTKRALDQLEVYYSQHFRGLTLIRYGDVFQLVTKKEYADALQRLMEEPSRQSLTQSALETLTVIAYRQPVTKVELDHMRGVKSDRTIASLLAKGLITEVGRKETIGRPILYGTTDLFLNYFGIVTLDELPPLPEEADGEVEITHLFGEEV
ncbi:MAG: SMC-Scp complex subunit ScpB [Bacilli bacterium]